MKKNLMMALVAVTMLASCSKEDNGGEGNNGIKTLKLSINSGKFSRAAEAPLADDSKTEIKTLYVYFVDKTSPDAGAVVLGSKALSADDITAAQTTAGCEITGVNSAAKSVYVVANYTENGVSLGDPAGTTIASIQAKVATMGSSNKTTSWGQALLSNAPSSYGADNGLIGAVDNNNKASVAVSIMPSLSRIEVASLATDPAPANEIKVSQFDLNGVYLNGYYPQFSIAGVAQGTPQVINTAPDVAIKPVPDWYKNVYTTALTGKTTYTAADGTGATAGYVWAYMLPAAAPRVIFHISNIKYGAGADVELGRDQYLTVKSFKYAASTTIGGTDHAEGEKVVFARGCIYRVSSVLFDLSKLHDNPNADNVDVTVKVTVLAWQGIGVTPEF